MPADADLTADADSTTPEAKVVRGGCHCRMGGGTGSAGAFPLLLGLLLLRRRRR
jgi:MYXO-CTERM domain-containing protein